LSSKFRSDSILKRKLIIIYVSIRSLNKTLRIIKAALCMEEKSNNNVYYFSFAKVKKNESFGFSWSKAKTNCFRSQKNETLTSLVTTCYRYFVVLMLNSVTTCSSYFVVLVLNSVTTFKVYTVSFYFLASPLLPHSASIGCIVRLSNLPKIFLYAKKEK
jgi:hypothetical protein